MLPCEFPRHTDFIKHIFALIGIPFTVIYKIILIGSTHLFILNLDNNEKRWDYIF